MNLLSGSYFNTSHVSINHFDKICKEDKEKFQYISCFY